MWRCRIFLTSLHIVYTCRLRYMSGSKNKQMTLRSLRGNREAVLVLHRPVKNYPEVIVCNCTENWTKKPVQKSQYHLCLKMLIGRDIFAKKDLLTLVLHMYMHTSDLCIGFEFHQAMSQEISHHNLTSMCNWVSENRSGNVTWWSKLLHACTMGTPIWRLSSKIYQYTTISV